MEKLSADALRLALVTASMEYYKKYVEGNQDFDNSEQIKEELGKLEAAGLGGTKNAETLRTILESKKYKSALGPEKLDLKKVNEMTSWIKESYPDALVVTYEDFFKMKEFVQDGSKLQAVKHVKESAKCGLKEAKDFVDTYCDYVL